MKYVILLLAMLMCHIIDDFGLQGILAQFKQKSFWEDKGELYKNDYKSSLLLHALSWTISINIPVIVYIVLSNKMDDLKITTGFCWIFIANWLVHAFIDDCKANKKYINLNMDQSLHMLQILCIYLWTILFV